MHSVYDDTNNNIVAIEIPHKYVKNKKMIRYII